MSLRVIKQPDGLYAVYETVIDDFVAVNLNARDTQKYLTDEYVSRAKRDAKSDAERMMKRADQKPEEWAKKLAFIRESHGQSAIDELMKDMQE